MTIEILLNTPPQQGVKRIGDIGKRAPYVVLYSNGEKMVVQMPITVSSRNNILWDQKNFTEGTIAGSTALDVYNNQKLKDMSSAVAIGGRAKEAGMDILESKTASAIGGAFQVQDAADYMRHQQGKAINPNKELMFQGMAFRAFTFEWEFIPTNQEQANQINEFIYTIQYQSSCGFAGGGKTYLSYPDAWQILFYPQRFLPLIMPCYLTDYTINYGGAGRMVFHPDGEPIQVNIACTFTESQLHTRDQIEQGFWG